MPKQLDTEARREYQRAYRAKRKSIPEIRDEKWVEMQIAGGASPDAIPPKPAPKPKPASEPAPVRKPVKVAKTAEQAEEHVENMSAMRRERAVNHFTNPFNDGMEDTGYLIQRVPGKQIDAWLARINRGSEYGKK